MLILIQIILVYACIVTSAENRIHGFKKLQYLGSRTSSIVQQKATEDLIERLLPEKHQLFHVVIDSYIGPIFKDTFQLTTDKPGHVTIHATSGVAAAWGFQHYLKYYCGCQISWAGAQLSTPPVLPSIPHPGLTITSNDRFRYYQNVCTVSYSSVWWDEIRWRQEVDWMAMNGINLPLAFTGQEAIYQRVYKNLGLKASDLDDHFGGPAFLAWSRMGNMHGWGGPLPQAWIDSQLSLQHKILAMMRSFGMIPVLPAFAGHIPDAMLKYYPNLNVTRMSPWGGIGSKYCCPYLLDFKEPLFRKIASMIVMEQIHEYGTDHVYNADTFNEMPPKYSTPEYLTSASKAVYEGMAAADPHAIWLMQGWLFLEPFWTEAAIKAYLSPVPRGSMLILDLFSDVIPLYNQTKSYYGHAFIWCMLHNFGGTLELYGDLNTINTGPFLARSMPNSTMVGTGLTPEGINQNEVVYEFMNENAWRQQPRNITQWIQDFARRRYGRTNIHIQAAWKLLQLWYDTEKLYKAWSHLLRTGPEVNHSALFRYDLVDVGRQSLQWVAYSVYLRVVHSYRKSHLHNLIQNVETLLGVIKDLDRLLASDNHFLLGDWLRAAKAMPGTEADKQLYEFNARNQITTWGPTAGLDDYAAKEWAGLTGNYYYLRWEYFTKCLLLDLLQGIKFNETKVTQDLIKLEERFSYDTTVFPSQPQGDPVAIGVELYNKYIGHLTN